MKITTNIELVVRFVIDAVELIKNNFDVKEAVKTSYLGPGDYPAFIRFEMMERGVQADYLDLFDCADQELLFNNYVTVKEEKLEFDYSEASGAGKDRAKCYFKVPCEFDLLGYINMLYKMNLESDNKILVTVYKDTVIPGSKDDDNLMDIEVDKNILTAYFKERILPSFKGDDKSISDEGLFEEWLSECTADDTDDLWDYIISQKDYYIDLYNKAYDRFLEQAKKDGSANPEDTANELFDESATAGEVVGCYLVYHGDDAYKDWMENLTFYTERSKEKQEEFPPIKKAQDEEVTRILARLCDNAAVEITSTPILGIKKYAVTSYWCGEEGATKIWLCSSEKEAIDKMRRLWKKSYNFALEDENFDKERTYHEELEGRVAWDDELYRVFEVIQIADADDEEI